MDNMQVHNMFATPDSMEAMTDYLESLNEPTAFIAAIMMWNLIASGNHIDKEDQDDAA